MLEHSEFNAQTTRLYVLDFLSWSSTRLSGNQKFDMTTLYDWMAPSGGIWDNYKYM